MLHTPMHLHRIHSSFIRLVNVVHMLPFASDAAKYLSPRLGLLFLTLFRFRTILELDIKQTSTYIPFRCVDPNDAWLS